MRDYPQPLEPGKNAGGSSGGASASLAGGMGTIALGSDAAGSIRGPSSVTGVFGLKTTFGRVADYPSSYLGTLAVVGPMTRTVADAALCMNIITRPDPRDSYALPGGDFDFVAALTGDLTGLRVAYSPTLGFAEIAPDVAAIVADGVELLEQLGAQVDLVEHVFDDPGEVLTTLMLPGVANAFRVFGFTAADKALMNPRLLDSAEKGARIPVVEFLAAREKREHLGALMRSFHERYDILVTPARSLPAIGADEDRPSDPRYRNITDSMSLNSAFNLTKQPAASVPVARSAIVIDSRWSSPCPATISVCSRTSMFSAERMRSTRYRDIDFSSDSERTSITTRLAWRARLSAAWPAELAAPTM